MRNNVLILTFTVESKEYGREEFGEYDSLLEALAGLGRVAAKAAQFKDGVERFFTIDGHELVFTSGEGIFKAEKKEFDSLDAAIIELGRRCELG